MANQPLEPHILKVDKYFRVVLPQSLVQEAGWINKNNCNGWLLMGSPSRYRLLSPIEIEEDPQLKALNERIAAELNSPMDSPLDFLDAESVGLALRLSAIQITPPKPAWRLLLPKPIATLMQIHPGESDLAALFIQGHIEFWTIEMLRVSVTTPLSQII